MPNAAATVSPWKRLPSVSEQMSRSRISRSPAAKADSSIGPARTATARPSLVRVTVSGHGPGMPGSCWSSMTARLSFQGHNRLIFRHQDHDGFPSSRAFRARLRRPPADRSGGAGEDRADPDCAGAGLPRSRHRLPAANPQVRPRAQSTTTGGLGQLSVLLIMRRDRPLLPLVISLPRHFQHAAHENDGKAHSGRQLPLLFRHLANERELHRFWLAKYALAFFRNAFSMLRRRTSASSSLIRVRSAGVSGASPAATASLSLSFLTQLARVDSFSPRWVRLFWGDAVWSVLMCSLLPCPVCLCR